MFRHVKQLQYTVRVAEPNPGLAWPTFYWNNLADRRVNWPPPAVTLRKG